MRKRLETDDTDGKKLALFRKQLFELPDLENLLTMSVPNLFIENENTLFFEKTQPLPGIISDRIGISGTGTKISNQFGGMDGDIEMVAFSKKDGSEQPKKFITGILFKGDGNITINTNLVSSVINSSLLGSEYKKDGNSITGPETFGLLCYLLDNKDFFEENTQSATRPTKNYYEEVENRVEQIHGQYLNLVGGEPISGDSTAMDVVEEEGEKAGEGEEEGKTPVVEQPKFGSETTHNEFEGGENAGRDRTGEEQGADAGADAGSDAGSDVGSDVGSVDASRVGTTLNEGAIGRVSFNENKKRRVHQNQE